MQVYYRKHLTTLKENRKKVVYGQDTAIDSSVDKVVISKDGVKREDKHIGSFVFMGPTGCGKTETAKQLAEGLGVKLVTLSLLFEPGVMMVVVCTSSCCSPIGFPIGLLTV